GATHASARPEDFPKPQRLRPAIEFWKRVFGSWSKHQVVVHDTLYLGKVYDVVDFRDWYPVDGSGDSTGMEVLRKARVEEAKERVRQTLLRLHSRGPNPDPASLGPDERRVQAMFADVSGDSKYLDASERLRTQAGLRENFYRGLSRQSRYIDKMEAMFAARGLPVELARLPLVESTFNVEAYSKVGAAGVWQLMPSTGRQYMRVANDVDERRDPIRATAGAVRHLSGDHDALGAWPLAITAYNHGRAGVANGVAETGTTDMGEIATRYHGRAFGFASRNFYAEFVAVLELIDISKRHFRPLHSPEPLDAVEVRLDQPMRLRTAASLLGVSDDELASFNPALMPSVRSGSSSMPQGYVLRVPGAAADSVARLDRAPAAEAEVQLASVDRRAEEPRREPARMAEVESPRVREATVREATVKPVRAKEAREETRVVAHRVTAGQTLFSIARRYGTTVALIQGMNGLRGGVQAGQLIRVPSNSL
ncbi:MAG: transglycosylase SLT domain-containing protein, partial [Alphaproteobacteria bacterium]